MTTKNYITPAGLEKLRAEIHKLRDVERPKVVAVVSWAAANGDRSENADYIYGKRRMREIDRRVEFLLKRLDAVQVVDPTQAPITKVCFGVCVTIEDEEGTKTTYQIVGEDEINAKLGQISWKSPLAKALLGKKQGDAVTVHRPAGSIEVEIVSIRLPNF